MRALLPCLILLLFVSACAYIQVVEPKRQNIADRYWVTTPIAWSSMPSAGGETWTINGTALDELNLLAGIEPGNSLVAAKDGAGEPPYFKAGMRANEVMELVTDSLAYQGFKRVKGSKLRPAKFGQLRGFRFEFVFTDEDGLRYAGKAIGAVDGNDLHLIVFSAPFSHYFPTYHQQVEQIFRSIEIAPPSA